VKSRKLNNLSTFQNSLYVSIGYMASYAGGQAMAEKFKRFGKGYEYYESVIKFKTQFDCTHINILVLC